MPSATARRPTAAKTATVRSVKVKDADEAARRVLAWFVRTNSPATAQSLTDALGSCVPKPLVQRTLDALHAQQRLLHKDLKKVRFYYYNHAHDDDDDDDTRARSGGTATPDEAASSATATAASTHAALAREALMLRARVRDKAAALQALRAQPTRAERAAQRRAVADEVAALRARVAQLQTFAAAAAADACATTTVHRSHDALADVRTAVHAYVEARRRWRAYKECTMQLAHAAAAGDCDDDGGSGCGSVADVLALACVRRDEDVGVSYNDTAVLLPRALHAA